MNRKGFLGSFFIFSYRSLPCFIPSLPSPYSKASARVAGLSGSGGSGKSVAESAANARAANRVTVAGAAVNVFLVGVKLVAGLAAGSAALVSKHARIQIDQRTNTNALQSRREAPQRKVCLSRREAPKGNSQGDFYCYSYSYCYCYFYFYFCFYFYFHFYFYFSL